MKTAITAVLLAGSVMAFGCRHSRATTVPEDLLGRWTTTDPRYKGRYFEFTQRGGMRVGTGDDNMDIYTIWNIESEPEDAFTRYTVTYLNSDAQEYKLLFYYDAFDGGIIRFINQDLKWAREEE